MKQAITSNSTIDSTIDVSHYNRIIKYLNRPLADKFSVLEHHDVFTNITSHTGRINQHILS